MTYSYFVDKFARYRSINRYSERKSYLGFFFVPKNASITLSIAFISAGYSTLFYNRVLFYVVRSLTYSTPYNIAQKQQRIAVSFKLFF